MLQRRSTLSLVMIAMFAALTAIGAFIKVPLPVVPFTLQIVFVFWQDVCLEVVMVFKVSSFILVLVWLVYLFYTRRRHHICIAAHFWLSNRLCLAAFVIGLMLERVEVPTKKHFIGANIVGLIIIYAVAVPYLYVSLNFWLHMKTSWTHIFLVGF